MDNIKAYADKLISFFDKRHTLQNKPTVIFQDDPENRKNLFGKTAHYDPRERSITVFTSGRHPKDCLRSLAHELVHHMQCERGDLDKIGPTSAGYAQKNPHLRQMEREAYLVGNMCFRDFEDEIKSKGIQIKIAESRKQLNETNYSGQKHKGDVKMSTTNWKNKELNTLLMEKWGYKPKDEKNKLLEEEVNAYATATNGYQGYTQNLEEEEELTEEEIMAKLEEEDDALEERTAKAPVYNVGQVKEQKLRLAIRNMIKKMV